MKQFKFKTSKGDFLLVDEDLEGKVRHPQGVEYSEIGRLRTITEEQASEIVDKVMNNQHFQNYDFKEITDRWTKSAIESLHSLLKSKGIYLFEHPLGKMDRRDYIIEEHPELVGNPCEYDEEKWEEDLDNHYEAEMKTFYNPILFKINVGSSKNNS